MREFDRYEKSVLCGEKSIRFRRAASYLPSRDKIERRGEITGFSRHSALRLRESLATLRIPHSRAFGVTLTVPWQMSAFLVPDAVDDLFHRHLDLDRLYGEYKAAFNRFGVAFRRMFPNSAAIFRHELQTRKMPHVHLVVYFSQIDLPFRVTDVREDDVRLWIRTKMYELWQRAIKFKFYGGSVEGFYRSGICVQSLADLPAIFRYIADHASKHKQSQLGYKGKQWGFLNRSLLVCGSFTRMDFKDSRELVLFQRTVTKLCRFKVTGRSARSANPLRDPKTGRISYEGVKPFGYKLSSRRRLVSIQFVNFNTARRIFDWIVSMRSGSMEGGRICESRRSI